MYNLELSEIEKNTDIIIDINDTIGHKIEGLKNYRSQEDAQEFATHLSERSEPHLETFAISESSPSDWETYPIINFLRSI